MRGSILDVFLITEKDPYEEEPAKSIWIKIGVAFVNKDESLNVVLDAIPLHGKLHIRERKIIKANQKFETKVVNS